MTDDWSDSDTLDNNDIGLSPGRDGYRPGVTGVINRGLGGLGVSVSESASGEEESSWEMIWSPKCALNMVDTGRNFNAGNSETLAGALCGNESS